MKVDRRVVAGGATLIGFVVCIHVVMALLPSGSSSRAALVDIALPILETVVLALTWIAFRRNSSGPYRWTWLLLCLWLASNLFADAVWGWYEVVLRSEVPSPSAADVGYLISYPLGFLTVVFAAWKSVGRLRAVEAGLDALVLTLGLGGLAWPVLLAPLLDGAAPGPSSLISLAYPIGDLLVIVAFVSLALGSYQRQPPTFLITVWLAFIVQVIADSLYFVVIADNGNYTSGSLLDSLWAFVFAVVGIAALIGIFPAKKAANAAEDRAARLLRVARADSHALTLPRMLIPYLALPMVGALIYLQLTGSGATWNRNMEVLVFVAISLAVLLVIRQYVTLVDNRRLNQGLSSLSRELGDRVHVLGGLTDRLEELNTGAMRLNSLRALSEIMRGGLELACSVTRSAAGWVTLLQDDGSEIVEAALGPEGLLPELGTGYDAASAGEITAQQVRLEARGEHIGTLWLLRPSAAEDEPDLVHAVGAQLATAIDNTRRYEEALRLAERDPLTGLYNHRGIHQRLAIEGRRAQQRGGTLSLVMIDLDDFKLLNDTYGHPAGDRVLSQVSESIRSVLRHSDLAGRVGGDEMMLVLPDTDREGAMRLAERLRGTLSEHPFKAGQDRGIPLRLSLGVATYPTDADTLTGLVGVADASLYASKQRGGDTITEAGAEAEPMPETPGIKGIAGRLMDAVGARDHYTRRHSDQVATHAVNLGQSLGLPTASLDTLKLAAMLHDVGKLGLGPRVLRKPAPLTDEEERSVRRHIDIGETIIRDLPRVAEILDTVHSHHERYDGTGYPTGLLGDDIPLLARILAVADAYAAMTVDRPYRAKLTGDQARDELMKVSGSQLDPELVTLFVKALDDQPGPRFAAAS